MTKLEDTNPRLAKALRRITELEIENLSLKRQLKESVLYGKRWKDQALSSTQTIEDLREALRNANLMLDPRKTQT